MFTYIYIYVYKYLHGLSGKELEERNQQLARPRVPFFDLPQVNRKNQGLPFGENQNRLAGEAEKYLRIFPLPCAQLQGSDLVDFPGALLWKRTFPDLPWRPGPIGVVADSL